MTVKLGNAAALTCRECGKTTPLGPFYACEDCFGPLEVSYDLPQLTNELMEKATPKQIAAAERHFASMPIEKQQLILAQNFPRIYAYFRELAYRHITNSHAGQQSLTKSPIQEEMAPGQPPPRANPKTDLDPSSSDAEAF